MENKKSAFDKIGSLVGDIFDYGGKPLEILISKETHDEEMEKLKQFIPDFPQSEVQKVEMHASPEINEMKRSVYKGEDLEIDGQMHVRSSVVITPSEDLPKGQFVIKGFFE